MKSVLEGRVASASIIAFGLVLILLISGSGMGIAKAVLPPSSVPLDPNSECLPVHTRGMHLVSASFILTLSDSGRVDVTASYTFNASGAPLGGVVVVFPFLAGPDQLSITMNGFTVQGKWVNRAFNMTFKALQDGSPRLLEYVIDNPEPQFVILLSYTRDFVVHDDPEEWGKRYYRIAIETSTLGYSDATLVGSGNSTMEATFRIDQEIFTQMMGAGSLELAGTTYVNGLPHRMVIMTRRSITGSSSVDLPFYMNRGLGEMLTNIVFRSSYRYYIWAFVILFVLIWVFGLIRRRLTRDSNRRKRRYMREASEVEMKSRSVPRGSGRQRSDVVDELDERPPPSRKSSEIMAQASSSRRITGKDGDKV